MAAKKFFINAVLLVLLITSTLTYAQPYAQQYNKPQHTPEERAQSQMKWIQSNLGLSDKQNKKVYTILLNTERESDKINFGPEAGRDTKLAEVMKTRIADLKGVLNDDQYQKYEAHQREIEAMMEKIREQQEKMMEELKKKQHNGVN